MVAGFSPLILSVSEEAYNTVIRSSVIGGRQCGEDSASRAWKPVACGKIGCVDTVDTGQMVRGLAVKQVLDTRHKNQPLSNINTSTQMQQLVTVRLFLIVGF